MNPLFETVPIPNMKPDGRIERRGRPRKTNDDGQHICSHCSAPITPDKEYDPSVTRKAALEQARTEAEQLYCAAGEVIRSGIWNSRADVLRLFDSLLEAPQEPQP